MRDRLRGVTPAVVRAALDASDPLPGASGRGSTDMGGFGGVVDDRVVRDVLGRQPVYTEAGAVDPTADGAWAFAPSDLDDPVVVPPGTVRTAAGDSQRLELPEPPVEDPEPAQRAVDDALTGALGLGAEGQPADTAVAFSGGVDSALVAAGLPDAPLYVIGFEGSHDIAAARAAAAEMGRTADLRVLELNHETLREAVPRVAEAINRTNPMDVSIALPLLLVAERVRADGYDRLALGQGADELFGGYSKVVEPAEDHRVEADTVRGAVSETIDSLPEQLERDVCGLQAVGVDPVTPCLQDRVVDAALRLPGELLASGEERKIALRRFARRQGVLPESVASTDKKAVQYGSY
ncbi:MAG: asparagine synthase-related protein, partial [Halohasta sp.]